MATPSIHDVADYIVVKLNEAGAGLNILKLQKLLFYVQAWHLALRGDPLFVGKFQAWVHGPVNREIYARFASTHMMYDMLTGQDVRPGFDMSGLSDAARSHIDEILDAYATFSGPQLESMTHNEDPWIRARGNLKPADRCETELDESFIKDYYRRALDTPTQQ